MSISFACPSCGKGFSVPAASAGRQGYCKACGHAITVPSASVDEDEEYGIAKTGYGLAEPEVVAVKEESASVFTKAARDVREDSASRRRKSTGRRRKAELEPFAVRHWKGLIGIPLAVVGLLLVVAVALPNGAAIASATLAVIGAAVVLVGYVVSIYVAFSEDGMHGWLCLLIPFYMAYYIVSRLDEMWPWFATMTAGAGFIAIAGWIGGSEQPEEEPDPAELGRIQVGRSVPLVTIRVLAESPPRA